MVKYEKRKNGDLSDEGHSEDGLNFHGKSVNKIRPKTCVNPIKTAVYRVIFRVNDLSLGEIKRNLRGNCVFRLESNLLSKVI